MRPGLHKLIALACLLGCHCVWPQPPNDDPPRPDCPDCEQQFELDPACELPGELTVAIGEGANAFGDLAEGQAPEYYLGPQGGGHHYFAVRVGNVEADRYDMIELVLDGYFAEECPEDQADCAEGYRRRMVLSDPHWRVEDGVVEEHGILMQLEGESVLQVVARDPCGREGRAQHRW